MNFLKKILLVCILTTPLMACGPEGSDYSELPPGILGEEELIPLMVDLQFEIALHQKRYIQRNGLQELVLERYDSVFVAHGIDQEDYENSIMYYSDDPEYLLELYERVLEEISTEMGEIKARKKRKDEED